MSSAPLPALEILLDWHSDHARHRDRHVFTGALPQPPETGERILFAADSGHPLAGRRIRVGVLAHGALEAPIDGHLDLASLAAARGCGLQAWPPQNAHSMRLPRHERGDERDDGIFYAQPRRVHHIDSRARQELAALYGRLLTPGSRVLDLMAGWRSHLPDCGLAVTGLGMNDEEMADNPVLAEYRVHDLNRKPHLPLADAAFDAVVCSLSIEYLTQPMEVLADVRRVLRPGGLFVVSFSERWFPTKAIGLWLQLQPFERLGLVLDWLRQAGFTDLSSESLRGWPRPPGDIYINRTPFSDPLYAAWGHSGSIVQVD
ncbi:MAG: class I SAM-dependent methyltransferase [Rhodocyclaceae bacterium]|nr:class I SAM-dependent methyltransferase [Rhodocyclaceae bacterium]